MSKAYFAQDGNYGDAYDVEIVDTTRWTEKDWQDIDDELDYARPELARAIAQRYNDEIEKEFHRGELTHCDTALTWYDHDCGAENCVAGTCPECDESWTGCGF